MNRIFWIADGVTNHNYESHYRVYMQIRLNLNLNDDLMKNNLKTNISDAPTEVVEPNFFFQIPFETLGKWATEAGKNWLLTLKYDGRVSNDQRT